MLYCGLHFLQILADMTWMAMANHGNSKYPVCSFKNEALAMATLDFRDGSLEQAKAGVSSFSPEVPGGKTSCGNSGISGIWAGVDLFILTNFKRQTDVTSHCEVCGKLWDCKRPP
jgi:hypothetical protein